MRKTVAIVACAYALFLPVASGTAAARKLSATATRKALTKIVTRKVTGTDAAAGRWGSVQVVITVETTASPKPTSKYTDLGGSYSYHTSRSQFIMSEALPLLRQEFLAAQSANIQMVSGASYTSQAFEQSLQSALLKISK
jgi:uncharacterized protein with FMN-binding domain